MKKQTRLILGLTGMLMFLPTLLPAQNKASGKSSFSAHIGPAWYTGHLIGITNHSDAYRSNLRKGIAWSLNYWYTDKGPREEGVTVGPGLLYQGSLYKEKHENGSDKILMNYVAPQIGVFFLRTDYQIQLSAGAGYRFYADKSMVYGKPRKVSMDKLACNLALAGEYLLTRQWGVSARFDWVLSDSERYSVDYNGKNWQVNRPESGYGCLGQLSLTFGLNYHF